MLAAPPATNWQTLLADLVLILFMITASALNQAENAPEPPSRAAPPAPPPAPVRASPQAEPVAVWRESAGAPPLARWLADNARDTRLRLSVVVRFRRAAAADAAADSGAQAQALSSVAALLATAGPRAATARLIVEPGPRAGVSATLNYDADLASGETGTPIAQHEASSTEGSR